MDKKIPFTSKISILKTKKEKTANKKKVKSNWFVTVNTHIHRKSLDTPFKRTMIKRELEERIASVVNDNYRDFVKIMDENASHEDIDSIENRIKIEFQKEHSSHDLHSHNLLRITHSTRVQLDYKKFKNLLKDAIADLGQEYLEEEEREASRHPNVDIKWGSDSGDPEIEYMEKGTYTEWEKKDVSKYYNKLKRKGETDPELFNRFKRSRRK